MILIKISVYVKPINNLEIFFSGWVVIRFGRLFTFTWLRYTPRTDEKSTILEILKVLWDMKRSHQSDDNSELEKITRQLFSIRRVIANGLFRLRDGYLNLCLVQLLAPLARGAVCIAQFVRHIVVSPTFISSSKHLPWH